MKKLVVILLALQVISAGYLPAELIKLGNLYSHFIEHRDDGSGIGLIQFISLHYFDAKHQASDPLHHDSLPLQQCGHLFSVVSSSPIEGIQLSNEAILVTVTHFPRYVSTLTTGSVVSVFQPPKLS